MYSDKEHFINNVVDMFNKCKSYNRACLILQDLLKKNIENETVQQWIKSAFHYSRFGTGSR